MDYHSKCMDINWLKDNYEQIHYFGLGFIQIKLDFHQRVHFYINESVTVQDEEVHGHRYDFCSLILTGEFRQVRYEIIEGNTHKITKESCNPDIKSDKNDVSYCSIVPGEEEIYKQGDIYLMKSDEYHTVSPKYATITLLTRSNYKSEMANVITRVNSTAVCPFSRNMTTKELWEKVEVIINNAN